MKTEDEVKRYVVQKAKGIDYMSAMSLPRKDRRRLATINGGAKIVGSTRPYIREMSK